MKLNVFKMDGSKGTAITVDETVFGIEPNEAVVHQAVVSELSNRRQGTRAAKSRGMVRGGGKKPWKQKGRGAARAGTIRSPLWVGGGVVFGPHPHKHIRAIPKKMKQLARKSVLSDKAASGAIVVVNELNIEAPRTKAVLELLQALNLAGKKVTILPAVVNDAICLSVRNLKNVSVIKADHASAYDLLDNEVMLFDKPGLALINNQLTSKN